MKPIEATELLRMLTPVGGTVTTSLDPVERHRQCVRLRQHLKKDGGFIPRWLEAETRGV